MIRKNKDFQLVNKQFPHIGTKIFFLWSTDAFNSYLNDILTDTRDGERQGFPVEVVMALFRLQQEHDGLFPRTAIKATEVRASKPETNGDAHARFSDRSTVWW